MSSLAEERMKYAREVKSFSVSLEKQYALSRDATVSCINDLPHGLVTTTGILVTALW